MKSKILWALYVIMTTFGILTVEVAVIKLVRGLGNGVDIWNILVGMALVALGLRGVVKLKGKTEVKDEHKVS